MNGIRKNEMLFSGKWQRRVVLLLLLGLPGGDHDLFKGEGFAQVAADLNLAGHKGRGGGNLA